MRQATDEELDQMSCSDDYSEFIMNNCHGDRMIGNGDMLITAIEEGYLFDEYLESVGLYA